MCPQGGGPTYPIDACFLWSLASWDVLAVYPDSSATPGLKEAQQGSSYLDAEVARAVRQHNAAVLGSGGGQAAAVPTTL